MITGISIENFKGIRDRVELELKPLTLLFGPNSAGKSTILHALHYAREVFQRRNLDAHETTSGGDFVDLGGFHNLVHGQDRERNVVLQFSLDLEATPLPDYSDPYFAWHPMSVGAPESLVGEVHSATVLIAIAWSELLNAPFVQRYAVWINGEAFGVIHAEPGRPGARLLFNHDHSVFVPASHVAWLEGHYEEHYLQETSALLIYLAELHTMGVVPKSTTDLISFPRQNDALPRWGEQLTINYEFPPGIVAGADEVEALVSHIASALTTLLVGPGEVVRNQLAGFRYLGPLRKTPPRHFMPPRFADPSRWPSGLGAWDALCGDGDALVEDVSGWLSDTDRLDAGYHLAREYYKELDLRDPLLIQLQTGRAFDEVDSARLKLEELPTRSRLVVMPNGDHELKLQPHDVGIGISQLVPVVVTALDKTASLSAIEQPELHVHPRVQAEMGDLFIEAAIEGKRQFLIETHSEHLMLRLQRRIRQTGKGEPHRGVPVTGNDIAVYFVNQEEGQTTARRIDIDKNGDFIEPWPDDFFEVDFYERFH